MDTPFEKYFRMGIVHFMAFPELGAGEGPWEETLRHIALDPFFSVVEVTRIVDPKTRERVKKLIEEAGLSVAYAAHPAILGQGLDVNSLDEDHRVSTCDILKQHLDEAITMGAENFVLLSGRDPGDEKRPDAVQALVKSLGELCAYSTQKGGPIIVIESFDREVDKCCLLGPATLAMEVAEAVRSEHDNFGLMVDLGHIPLLKETPMQALAPVKDYLSHIHLGNAVLDKGCAGYGDNHPIFGMPGSANGLPEMIDFLKTLLDIGFLDGHSLPIVSFEIKPLEGQDSLSIIANAKRMLNRAWAMV
jgi:sugar phosphate isomerase/epimerase